MKRIISAFLIISILFALSGCNRNTGEASVNGSISSVTPTKMLGKLADCSTALEIATNGMEEQALKNALKITPETDYSLKKQSGGKYTLSFAEKLAEKTLYTVCSVEQGRTLYSWAFQTATDFAVTSSSPEQGAVNVSCESKITIKMSGTGTADIAGFEDNFSIFPAVNGSFSVKNGSGIFTPSKPLAINTRYTVTLKKNVCNGDKITLAEDYILHFTTGISGAAEKSFAYIAAEGDDYADSFVTGESPYAVIQQQDLSEKSANAELFSFNSYSDYLSAHKTYFSAPDFSDIDTLLTKMTPKTEFSAMLVPIDSSYYMSYPETVEPGYYICRIKVAKSVIFHVFTVSDLSVFSITAAEDCHVWVNNTKTGNAVVGVEVMLDNSYNKKTDGNGIARFTLKNDSSQGHYIVIPHNRNMPFISYIRDGNTTAQPQRDYYSGLYSGSRIYAAGDTVSLFGCVLKRVADTEKATDVKLCSSWDGHFTKVTPDDDGCFTASLPLNADYGSTQTVSLLVNGVVTCSTDISVMSTQASGNTVQSTADKIGDYSNVGLFAAYSSGVLKVSSSMLSTAVGVGSPDEYWSRVYGRTLYAGNAYAVKYTVKTHKVTFVAKKAGAVYDIALGKAVQRTSYTQQDKVISTVSGNTENGTKSHALNYVNTADSYYYFELSFTDLYGSKRSYFVNEYYKNYLKSGSYSDCYALLCEGDISSATVGDSYKLTLMKGNEPMTSGRLMSVPVCSGIISSGVAKTAAANIKITDAFTEGALVYAAYFDGKSTYVVSPIRVQCDKNNKKLAVTAVTDKSEYSNESAASVTVAVKNNSGAGKSASVLVNVLDSRLVAAADNAQGFTQDLYADRTSLVDVMPHATGRQSYTDIDRLITTGSAVRSVSSGRFDYADSACFSCVATDKNGNVSVSVTLGKAVASYTVIVLAVASDGSTGTASCEYKLNNAATTIEESTQKSFKTLKLSNESSFDVDSTVTGGVMLYNSVYDGVFSALTRRSALSGGCTARLAYYTAQRSLGAKPSFTEAAALSRYQSNGGISASSGGKASLALSAHIAALLGEQCSLYFNKAQLQAYLQKAADNTKASRSSRDLALYGLAALHCNVLDSLLERAAAKPTGVQRMYVALGLAYAGDFDAAKELLPEIRGNFKFSGEQAHYKSDENTKQLTAAAAMLCARLGCNDADALVAYLAYNETDSVESGVCDAAYIKYYQPYTQGKCSVTVKSDNKTVTFEKYRIYEYKTDKPLSSLVFSSADSCSACIVYDAENTSLD